MENKQFPTDPRPDMWSILEQVKHLVILVAVEHFGPEFKNLYEQLVETNLENKMQRLEALRGSNPELYDGVLTATALVTNCFNVAEMSYRHKSASKKYPADYEGSIASTIKTLSQTIENNVRLNQVEMRLTLTAHPTECNPIALNKILFSLGDRWSHGDIKEDEGTLALLKSAWKIISQPTEKPTPKEELEWAHWILEQQALPLVAIVCNSLDSALVNNGFAPQALTASPLKFGLWPSFDRDGNPNVTALNTWQGALESVRKIFACYCNTLDVAIALADQNATWHRDLTLLKDACAKISAIGDVFSTLQSLKEEGLLLTKEALLKAASDCYNKIESGAGEKNLLWNLIKQMASFGISLGTPQVRQESALHALVMDAITKSQGYKGKFSSWDETTKIEYFSRQEALDPIHCEFNETQQEVFNTFKTIARLNHCFPGLIDRYVISLAKTASDILAVDYLLIMASSSEGLTPCILNIYPLFESQEDVENSPKVLSTLFSVKYYRAQLAEHLNNVQGIMNSHSDYRKEQGNLKGYLGLFLQQEALARVCNENGITLKMFQGRGQSRARGQIDHSIDKILLMPINSVNFTYDQTWQGEGARHLFMANCGLFSIERHLSGILLASSQTEKLYGDEDIRILSQMAEASGNEYRTWIEKDDFMSLYDKVTIVNTAKLLPIGSRPAKRKTHKSSAKNLRAIAWNKCFHQDRLPVPVFLGMVTALDEGEGGCTEAWINSAFNKPLVRAFFQTLERGLATAKTDVFRLAAKTLGNEMHQAVAAQLIANYKQVVQKVNQLLGQELLLENNKAWMLGQIKYRNSFIDIAHAASILERKAANTPEEIEMTQFFKTVNAVSAGLLCTG